MKNLILLISCNFLLACSHTSLPPVPIADNVDLNRFMGDWYVIASIPTFIEKDATNAIENYEMNEDGSIKTTFSFHKGNTNGELKTYHPTGYVSNESNSIWGMQFIWPIKAEFIIAYLSDDYQNTIIARNARDYIWIMSRTPDVNKETYQELIKLGTEMGYDPELIKRVPQIWDEKIWKHTSWENKN